MIRILVYTIGATALLAACASPPPPAATAQKPAAAQPVAEENPLPSPDQMWDVTKLHCSNWVGAADDDRAAVGMFYYGWLVGKLGRQVVRPVDIQPNIRKALDFCGAHPNETIVGAFQQTLASTKGT